MPNSKALRAMVEEMRAKLNAAAYTPGDHPIVPVKIVRFMAEMAKLLAAAEAHLASSTDVEGWRSMDSAPRDGTPFLAVNANGPGQHRHFICFSAATREGQIFAANAGWCERGRDWPAYPTHWRPLPASPSPEKEGRT